MSESTPRMAVVGESIPDARNLPAAVDDAGARSLWRDGRWLRDRQGRYVLLRGVNLGSRSKRPPYLPVLPVARRTFDHDSVARELTRLEPELARLAEAGVNVVRLLVMWKAIEPRYQHPYIGLSAEGTTYLAAVRQVVDALYAHGMVAIIDFHQDVASEVYGGDGFPDWAIAIDEAHPRPRVDPKPTAWWGIRYYALPGSELSRGVRHTLQSFWRDSVTNVEAGLVAAPAQTHLIRTIGFTAAYFRGHPAVLGYEPFNEPHPAGLDKASFERDVLGRFYAAVQREVGASDPSAYVFVEPRMDWTAYPADTAEPSLWRPWSIFNFTADPRTFLDLGSPSRDARTVLSFHYYDPFLVASRSPGSKLRDRAASWPATFAAIDAAIRGQENVPFLTEFGCDQNWTGTSEVQPELYGSLARACMDLQYRQVEARLFNATYWTYDFYSQRDDAGRISENWNEENLSLLGPDGPQNLDVATRPYPMRSAAKPELLEFDLATRQGTIVLAGPAVDSPTLVFVPHTAHYRGGFEVRATTSRDVVWDPRRRVLSWWPRPEDRRHGLLLAPAGRLDADRLPPAGRQLLPRMRTWAFATP